MKINTSLTGLDQGKPAASGSSERAPCGSQPAAVASSSADTIRISPLSSDLQALEATLSSGGEFDRTKVDAIKDAIREGRLSINPDVIADKMLASALEKLPKES